MHAETAYLFRHALLRDAAYQLQLPGDRARLHGLALFLIENHFGGRPQPLPPLGPVEGEVFRPEATDAVAEELARHARRALEGAAVQDLEGLTACERLYLRRAAQHAEASFQNETAARLWREHADLVACTERGESLCRAAEAFRQCGLVKACEPLHREALAVHREARNRRGAGRVLGHLAGVMKDTGRMEEAEATYREALVVHRETGNRAVEGMDLENMATLVHHLGRIDEAERLHREAIAIHRETGIRHCEMISVGNLAQLCEGTGRSALAESLQEEVLAWSRSAGQLRTEGHALTALAGLYHYTGRLDLAERTFHEAIALDHEVSNRGAEGDHRCAHALLQLKLQAHEEARAEWCRGIALLREAATAAEVDKAIGKMRDACAAAGVPPLDAP